MRSGTTSLYRYLLEHPEIFMPRSKEVHFFDDRFHEGITWYARQFSDAGVRTQIGEATPNYMYDGVAMERILSVLPDVRLLVILRNPADRAYSHYWHNRSRGKESLSFTDAIAAEPMRMAKSTESRRTYSYLDRGRYHEQLVRVLERVSGNALHVSVFDDLLKEPRSVFASICDFLGIDRDFVPSHLGAAINPFIEFRSIRLRRLAKHLPRPLRRAVGRVNVRGKDAAYEPLAEEIRLRVLEMLADDILRTSELIGRDLTGMWLREQA